jgi:ubiquinol-cytochrome c reductase cytochrome c subunit
MTQPRTLSLALSMLAASLIALAGARAAESGAVKHGQDLFMANNCYQCHGTVGQGGAGPGITPPHLPARTQFMGFVRYPRPAAMPPYTSVVLDDADLGAIWTYLNSIQSPGPALPEALNRLRASAAH